MLPSHKVDDHATTKRAIGRAMRKLTPRKSSFVNLLKGKGWGKGEEKSNDDPESTIDLSSNNS